MLSLVAPGLSELTDRVSLSVDVVSRGQLASQVTQDGRHLVVHLLWMSDD